MDWAASHAAEPVVVLLDQAQLPVVVVGSEEASAAPLWAEFGGGDSPANPVPAAEDWLSRNSLIRVRQCTQSYERRSLSVESEQGLRGSGAY